MNKFKSQTKRFDKTKNDRGITLVALIITIIILIILAVVTINSLTHDGLADMAIKGAEDYDKAQQNEMNMLNEIDNMVRDTIKNLEDGTTPPPNTPPQSIDETKEIANNNVGKLVDYMPATNQNYTVETKYSGYNSSQSFNTSDITGGWSLWGVDDKNIYVIADSSTFATSKTLRLANHLGYNNGVTLLDTICDTCFTNKDTYPNMKGQSLKFEQVMDVKASSITNDSKNYGQAPFSYNFNYPYIWNQYEKSDTENGQGAKDWEENRSIAYELTTQTTLTPSITYQPYSNNFVNNSMNTQSAWKNEEYFKMVMKPENTSSYWLSSRFVTPYDSTNCSFGLQSMRASGVDRVYLYRYNNGSPSSNVSSCAVRPLVSFPMANYALDNSGDTIKIVKRG